MITTTILPVDPTRIGTFSPKPNGIVTDWDLEPADSESFANLRTAARTLRESDMPVAFPTETVYGLGADATRSEAVKGIYKAKQRPSDNPLIVHFASLTQLEAILKSPVPSIYHSLTEYFWPGPLTVLLPLPKPSPFAPEISAGLSTFGARIPRNAIALALIQLADRPIAAPSANASTKPSPTAAEHVYDDLNGRIGFIIDGGPCDVGVESTVVDGLSEPPAVLRPGGISLEQIRRCKGWEQCVVGYKDQAEHDKAGESNGEGPRAPGMKYRHYSPKAKVVLYEHGASMPNFNGYQSIGVVRTSTWSKACIAALKGGESIHAHSNGMESLLASSKQPQQNSSTGLHASIVSPPPRPELLNTETSLDHSNVQLWDVGLGPDLDDVARGLFSALRELDRRNVEVIFVEGVDDQRGELAAAVMNRLRKASSVRVTH